MASFQLETENKNWIGKKNLPQNTHQMSHEHPISLIHATPLQNGHRGGPNILALVIGIGALFQMGGQCQSQFPTSWIFFS